jgi:SOS response regulatory protein OraA/RecX
VVYPKLALKVKSVLEETFAELAAQEQEMALDDGFDIYRQFTDLRALYTGLKNMPEEWPVHIEDLFIQFPKRWLQEVDAKVMGWVEGAVKQDKQMFSAMEGPDLTERQERHTSSVVDIFRSFNQSIGFLKELNWQDEYQYAKFMTVMTKILEKGVTRYCEELEYWFRHELNKKTPEQEAALTQTKQQKWMAMAKEAWSNEKKVEPFQFAPEVRNFIPCIFLHILSLGSPKNLLTQISVMFKTQQHRIRTNHVRQVRILHQRRRISGNNRQTRTHPTRPKTKRLRLHRQNHGSRRPKSHGYLRIQRPLRSPR